MTDKFLTPPPDDELWVKSIQLRMQEYGAGAQVSRDAILHSRVDALSFMSNQLAYSLTTTVLQHKLVEDTKSVPFKTEVELKSSERTFGFMIAVVVLAMALAHLIIADWIGALIYGVGAAAFAMFAWKSPRTYQRTVSGNVPIKAEYFNSFPENNIVYPDGLGNARRVVLFQQGDVA